MSTATATPPPSATTAPAAQSPKGPSTDALIAAAFNKPAPAATPPPPAPTNQAPQPKTPEAPKADTPKAPEAVEVKPSLLPKKTAPKTDAPKADAAPEPDAFDKYQLPDTAPEEQRSQFTELKRISREQAKRIKEYESKANAPTMPAPEVEKLRAEHKAMADRLATLDLQSHPEFKRQYDEPKTKALAEAKEVLVAFDKSDADVQALLARPLKDFNSEVSKITKDMDPMSALTVQNAMRQAYKLQQEEKSALAQSGELAQRLRQQSEAQAKQAFEEVSANLGPIGDFLVTLEAPEGVTSEERAEIEAYNQAVSSVRQNVEKTVFGKTDERGLATLGWKGATLDFLLSHGVPRMEKEFSRVVAERNAFAKELAAVRAAKGSGPIAGDPGKSGEAKKTTEQMIAEAYRGQR